MRQASCRRCKVAGFVGGISMLFVFGVLYTLDKLSVGDIITNEITLESFNQLSNKKAFIQHAEDMHRLQRSINVELGELEQRRKQLKESITDLESKNKRFHKQLSELEITIRQVNNDVSNMLAKRDETLSDYPPLKLPLPLLPASQDVMSTPQKAPCTMTSCFDYSRCSIMSRFQVYLYPPITENDDIAAWRSALLYSVYYTQIPDSACVFIVIIESSDQIESLADLSHWLGDGRNHVIINLSGKSVSIPGSRAMIASNIYDRTLLQIDFDISLPYITPIPIDAVSLPLLLPVRKAKLLTFYGKSPENELSSLKERQFVEGFQSLHNPSLAMILTTDCQPESECKKSAWCLCESYPESNTESIATFTAIPNTEYMPLSQFLVRLHDCLRFGSVPVILGCHHPLPLSEAISWSKALVHLPQQRVTEAAYVIRNILDPDIFEYKKRGRVILETHLSSISMISETILTLLRTRIGMPPSPLNVENSELIYSPNNPMLTFKPTIEMSEEIIGPLEQPFPSPLYERNFTSSVFISQSEPLHHQLSSNMYPNTPWDPVLPTDAKFHGSPFGFRPINHGVGGSGKEFSLAIGGNNPTEQFTIVILTYDRLDLLISQIAQFKNLPYLNKVLVVWNNPTPPDPALQWPELRVPIEVIKTKRNSLNNRFIPYKEIETEAILSLDDDMYLHDFEIILAFRIWREHRDRIVGFPGRYHAWNLKDANWNYNANHSCELSMILTGAAFFHKYYSYQYTYHMSQVIRDKVDEYMNCEDLAMNFLVSHITGKPPVKATSRWTFRCRTCGESSLWLDESHLKERHDCINFFIRVYGYLPLRYTQFRADSVLFKTRVPQDKTKCFVSV